MAILSGNDFEAVRKAIDLSIGVNEIPDAVIALDIYEPLAETMILGRDPLALTRTGDERDHIKRATIFLTAALLAVALPKVTSLFSDQVKYTRTIDWEARADDLIALSDAELDAVLSPDNQDDADRPMAFTLSPSGRSWISGSALIGARR